MTSAQWKQHLANQYQAMCAFQENDLFGWRIAPGQQVPYVTSYIVTYTVKTMVMKGDCLMPQMQTVVRIDLPASERDCIRAQVIGGEVPFSPNIYSNGWISAGGYHGGLTALWTLVIIIGRIIAFDPAVTNPESPSNSAAARDWKQKQAAGQLPYPCGRVDFPSPAGYSPRKNRNPSAVERRIGV